MGKKLFLSLVVVLLTACGGSPPPPPPAPTNVILEIKAHGKINPNPEGRSSPIAIRFYELKSLTEFDGVDFVSLYGKDKSVLGANLIQKHEVILQPNEQKTLRFVASDETRAIGAFAVFRSYEQAQWRASVPIRSHQTTEVLVSVDGTKLTMQSYLRGGTGK